MGRRRVVGAVALLLGALVGLGAWLQFGYERTPAPQRVTVTAAGPGVAFVLERWPGDPAPASEFSGAGFTVRADGTQVSDRAGASTTYSGPVGSNALLRVERDPDGTPLTVRVGGREPFTTSVRGARLDPEGEVATGEVPLAPFGLPVRVPAAAWLLLAWSVALGAGLGWTAYRAVRVLIRRSGLRWTVVTSAVLVLGAIGVVAVLDLPAPPTVTTRISVLPTRSGPPPAVRLERAGYVPPASVADDLGGIGWTVHDGWVVSRGVTRCCGAAWLGTASPDDRLLLRATADGSGARIFVDGARQRVRTGPAGSVHSVRLGDLRGMGSNPGATLLVVLATVAFVTMLLVGALALVVVVVARVRDGPAARTPHPSVGGVASWQLTWRLASIPLVGWIGLLILFWPGPMNPDALSQWFQVSDHVLTDWHPYLLALWFAFTRQIVDAPWLPILLLAVAASLLVGRIGAWAVARGRSVRATAWSSLLLLVVPATAFQTVTLWKDSYYGVALLAFVLCLWRIEDTRGTWLASWRNVAVLVLVAAGTWLVRHNGFPVVVGGLAIVALALRHWWRRFVIVGAAVVVIVGFVQVPLAKVLDVGPNPVGDIVLVQHLAMHLHDGVALTSSERRFLDRIKPVDQPWPYDCSSIQPTWSGPDAVPIDRFQGKTAQLLRTLVDLAWRDKVAEVRHIVCSSKIVWQPWPGGTQTYFMEWYDNGGRVQYLPVWLQRSPMEDPPSAGLVEVVYRAFTHVPGVLVRPAVYLYLLMIAAGWAVRRRRSWAPVRIVAPVIIQSIVLVFVSLVQDVRFQYGVILVAVVFVPMLASVRRRDPHGPDDPDEPVLVWRDWRSGTPAGEAGNVGREPLHAEALTER
ncbi:MAG: hypothetical protein WCI50_03050 [Actinomycetes bacterium]